MLLLTLPLFAAEPGMVLIPAGEFARGRTHALPDDGLKWVPELLEDDRPVKRIWIDAFLIDTHEVTNAGYAKFLEATKHRAPYNWMKGKVPAGKEKIPVAAVDWNDAAAYCAWTGKRLPTEAEWERAARGTAEGAKYPWGDDNATKKLACYDTLAGPCEVGKFPPNAFGLFDAAGNVWEWTADWYERKWYEKSPERNPKGPATGQYRVIRGGSWADVPKFLTTAYRSWARPLERSPNIGIRCAKDAPPTAPAK
ncbi:MAG: SUMF1/EgtB/PvdO family nonheme iron enzyme [Bryobacteraceae bacterium]